MANEKLTEQLTKLHATMEKWTELLNGFKKYALENDGVIDAAEQAQIDRIQGDIDAIKARIAQIDQKKGLGILGTITNAITSAVETVANAAATATTEKPKNELGLTTEEVKDKIGNFFAAFDKFTVVVAGTTVEVETPYFMNDGTASGPWDGNTVTAGKGSPKEVQEWLQKEIDKGKITSKDPAKLRQYMKDKKIGVDCSGFVSQALNHIADGDGDMEYGSDDPFKPDNTGSGAFKGDQFKKVEPTAVQIGDTLYFKNPTGKVNHIRIVGDVRKEGNVIYYTIFESAGSTGPRKMEWKYEDGKLQEFNGTAWRVKTHDTFYRWKKMDMEVPTGGGVGQGQQQDQNAGGEGTEETAPTASTAPIQESVGKGGKNKNGDVRIVQTLLNNHGNNLTVDGDCGAKTIAAIEKFQKEKLGFSKADGRVDPGGKTWAGLSAGASTTPTETTTEETTTPTDTTVPTDTTQPVDTTAGEVEEALSPTSSIKQSVGAGGRNEAGDVLRVKQLLNKFGNNLEANGTADAALTTAIKAFQTKYMGSSNPDGRVDAGGRTWNALLGIGRIQANLSAMAQQYGVEPAVILAIQQIESGGNGFFADGRPKILFEGHVFWKQLEKIGKNPQSYVSGNQDILYPSWDSSKYQGGVKEYDRLEKAIKIDEIAALKSASWGEFQIMGFNHATVGYGDVKSFVEAMKVPNGSSLKALMEFCKNNNLLRHVNGSSKDWAAFARGYNGPGYAKNQYDKKLAAAYERFKNV